MTISPDASKLLLYARNTAELYPQYCAIVANLTAKKKRGVYDGEKSIKLWTYWLESAAKRYVAEFAPGSKWYAMCPLGTRLEAAHELREEFEEIYGPECASVEYGCQ